MDLRENLECYLPVMMWCRQGRAPVQALQAKHRCDT